MLRLSTQVHLSTDHRWTTDGKLTRALLEPKHAVAHAYVLGLASPNPNHNLNPDPDPDH